MNKKLQIGVSDFKELIEGNYYFVDKSLIIKEFMDSGAKAILTLRPRRFGKTLNLSMLRYFFDIRLKKKEEEQEIKSEVSETAPKEVENPKNTFQKINNISDSVKKIFIDLENEGNDSRVLFEGLNIEKEEDIMKLQGQYPTLFITFKDIRYSCYEDFKDGMKVLLSQLYEEHEYLLESYKLSDLDKENYKKVMRGNISMGYLSQGISTLMRFMNKHYEKRVMLFIDEYDAPIQEAYIKEDYSEIVGLMRNLLTSALKDNTYLEKAFITGVLNVAEESIFSGFNNLEIDTILGYKFNDKFGFTQDELSELIEYYEVKDEIQELKMWYNGYVFGDKIICNPWSVLNYLNKRREGFMPYWINCSTNDLVKKLLLKNYENIKFDLEQLIKGNTITKIINHNISVNEIESSNENIWTVLVLTGYLKAIRIKNVNGRVRCELKIPNEEIRLFFVTNINSGI